MTFGDCWDRGMAEIVGRGGWAAAGRGGERLTGRWMCGSVGCVRCMRVSACSSCSGEAFHGFCAVRLDMGV